MQQQEFDTSTANVHLASPSGSQSRVAGDAYHVTAEEVSFFRDNGYLILPQVIAPTELDAIERVFEAFAQGEVSGMGKDYCDMSGSLARRTEDFALINAMLPRVYQPAFADNICERRTLSIARQLIGEDIGLDYDQFLAKRPGHASAVFAWHQDLAYWPRKTPDTRTVTCSLALDDADLENGCLRVVPGSHQSGIRNHRPLARDLLSTNETKQGTREEAHAQITDLERNDTVTYLPVRRGDITLHNESILHGSDGNRSNRWRRTYVLAYRSLATIQWERSIGFTHSHNDTVNWDNFDEVEAR